MWNRNKILTRQGFFVVKTPREGLEMNGVNLYTSETYSEFSQTSEIECFAEIAYSWKPLTILAKRSILDLSLGSEYAYASVLLLYPYSSIVSHLSDKESTIPWFPFFVKLSGSEI